MKIRLPELFRKRIFLPMAITLFAVTFSTLAVAIVMLYNTMLEQKTQALRAVVANQARSLEAGIAMMRHQGRAVDSGNILDLLTDELRGFTLPARSFGRSAEYVLAELQGDTIVFLQQQDANLRNAPQPVAFEGTKLAEPMRLALQGQSGVVVAQDYQGREVLAAYVPVQGAALGIVAKVDMAEVQAPFYRVGGIALLAALVFSSFGALALRTVAQTIRHRLGEGEERYLSLLEALPHKVYMTDLMDRVLFTNHQDKGSVLGQPLGEMLPALKEILAETEEGSAHLTLGCEDPLNPGHCSCYYRADWRYRQERDGMVPGRVLILTDVTELVEAEQKLERYKDDLEGMVVSRTEQLELSELRFRDFAATASDWLWELDENLTFTYVSGSVRDRLGVEPSWYIGKRPHDIGPKSGEDPDGSWAAHLELLEQRQPLRNYVVQHLSPDGKLDHHALNATPLFDEAGIFRGYRGSAANITEQVEATERLQALFKYATDGHAFIDGDGFVEVNAAMMRMFGVTQKEQLIGRPFWEFSPALQPDGQSSQNKAQAVLEQVWQERFCRMEWEYQQLGGGTFPVEITLTPIRSGNRELLLAIVHDLTFWKKAEQSIRLQNALMQTERETAQDGILMLELGQGLCNWNSRLAEIWGLSGDELAPYKKDPKGLVDILARHVDDSEAFSAQVQHLLDNLDKEDQAKEVRLQNGRIVERYSRGVVDEEKTFWGRVWHFYDVTEARKAEQRILYMAQHDRLTDLPNRSLFQDRLAVALTHARRKTSRVALLFVDLDGFKPINDAFGHTAGDHLLRDVAQRLKRALRESDTVARFGGDEFTVLLSDITEIADAEMIAEKLHASLRSPFVVKGKSVTIGASIGVAVYPEHGSTGEQLLQKADNAMYRAKSEGRSRCRLAR